MEDFHEPIDTLTIGNSKVSQYAEFSPVVAPLNRISAARMHSTCTCTAKGTLQCLTEGYNVGNAMEHRGGKDNAVDSVATEMDDKAEIRREREINERHVC